MTGAQFIYLISDYGQVYSIELNLFSLIIDKLAIVSWIDALLRRCVAMECDASPNLFLSLRIYMGGIGMVVLS